MGEWFEARKALVMFLGIVYILLALFVVPAFVKESVSYRKDKYLSILAPSSWNHID